MADTTYGINHDLTNKLWSKGLEHEVIGMQFFSKFMGKGDRNLLQIKDETSKAAGDRIRIGLRNLLTGSGVQADAGLEGNEEALVTNADNLFINQLRHAVRSNGRISEQRVNFSVREEARVGLADWWGERLEVSLANQLTGNTGQTDTRFTGNQVTIAPSTGAATRLVVGGDEATEASLSATTTHAIKLKELDDCVAIAKANLPRLRPLIVDGKKSYVAFLHPYQILQLRRDATTAGNFFDINKAILQGGKISDNPIINGASFMYNNVIVHEWDHLPNTVDLADDTNFRRGVFCGAQSAVIGFGRGDGPNKFTWVEESFDYGNKLGVAAGSVFGIKKLVFDSNDYGTITLPGYAPAP